MKHHALKHFRQPPEMLNCAQSILYAHQQIHGPAKVSLTEMKAFGGGRAPDGLCGALYSACVLRPEHASEIRERFAATTKSVYCKELKTSREACVTCVETAADILQALDIPGSR